MNSSTRRWLGEKWWAGVGVLIAVVALLVTIWAMLGGGKPSQSTQSAEFGELEQLDPNEPSSYLRVLAQNPYRPVAETEKYRSVEIGDGAIVEVVGRSTWTLKALSLKVGENVRIIANGPPGLDGKRGKDGVDGGRCGDGTEGGRGMPGASGRRGANILIEVRELQLPSGTVLVDARGGPGGAGGSGGHGGKGGQGSRTDSCGGGDGGRGGDGGDAGPGGAGGDLIVRYVAATGLEEEPDASLDPQKVRDRFNHFASGGSPGSPGRGGSGGRRGAGRGASILTFDSQPAGSDGSGGNVGDEPNADPHPGVKDIAPFPE